MQKLAGETIIFETLEAEKCKSIVKSKFEELSRQAYLPMKKWYLLVYDYYIIKNNLSYELKEEEKQVLNDLHDNTYDKNKFEELKLEMQAFLSE